MLKHSQQRRGPSPLTNTAISGGRETSPIHKAPGVRNLTPSAPSYPWSVLLVNHTTFITGADMTTLAPRTALALGPATQAAWEGAAPTPLAARRALGLRHSLAAPSEARRAARRAGQHGGTQAGCGTRCLPRLLTRPAVTQIQGSPGPSEEESLGQLLLRWAVPVLPNRGHLGLHTLHWGLGLRPGVQPRAVCWAGL